MAREELFTASRKYYKWIWQLNQFSCAIKMFLMRQYFWSAEARVRTVVLIGLIAKTRIMETNKNIRELLESFFPSKLINWHLLFSFFSEKLIGEASGSAAEWRKKVGSWKRFTIGCQLATQSFVESSHRRSIETSGVQKPRRRETVQRDEKQ